jgi:hypothetical protein
VVVLVLAVVLATTLLIASRGFKQEASRHSASQAYYSAFSVTQGFASWIFAADEPSASTAQRDAVHAFLEDVMAAPDGVSSLELAAADMPEAMGTACVTFTYQADDTDSEGNAREKLTISTEASYNGETETVSLAIYRTAAGVSFPYLSTDFDGGAYANEVFDINKGAGYYAADPSPVNVFGNQGTGSYTLGSTTTSFTDLRLSYPVADFALKRNFNNENQQYLLGGSLIKPTSSPPDPAIPATVAGNSDVGGYKLLQLSNAIDSPLVNDREVTWIESLSSAYYGRVTGVRDFPYTDGTYRNSTGANGGQGAGAEKTINSTAGARLVTPLNGKFALNPINTGSSNMLYGNFDNVPNTATVAGNTRFAFYNIDDTDGKDVYLRLANGAGLAKRTSNLPLFAYIGIDFTDNSTVGFAGMQTIDVPGVSSQAVQIANTRSLYQDSGVEKLTVSGVPFYPNAWKSARIYTTDDPSSVIDCELIFANYARIHTSNVLDYRSWANYVNHHYGAVGQNYDLLSRLPRINSTTLNDAKNLAGFPFPQVYWGNDFSMYLLDGASTTKAARIMQGVNIVNQKNADGTAGGVIYSTRALKIGGALIVRGGDGELADNYYDGLSTALDGAQGTVTYGEVERYQASYHQVIKDTDIILTSLDGRWRDSEICHPDSIGGFPGRTLTIEGGSIYVGENCGLKIDGEVKDGLTVNSKISADGQSPYATYGTSTRAAASFVSGNSYVENGNRMYVKPDKIVVDGGTLTILGNLNAHCNVITDIYVKGGGTLVIMGGAKIEGNIYCYDGGKVDIRGSFDIIGHEIQVEDYFFPGGIYIYGELTADPQSGELLGAGSLDVVSGIQIGGSLDGGNTAIGAGTADGGRGRAVHFLSATLFTGSAYEPYACSGHDATNSCADVLGGAITAAGATGGPAGVWLKGAFS